MGWLIALVLLVLLAMLPVGIWVVYDTAGPAAWLHVGPIRFVLYPSATKGKKKTKARKTGQTAQGKHQSDAKGGSLADFLPLLKIALNFLDAFRHKLRVEYLQLRLILGGDDPCDLSLNYGRGWAVLGNLVPLLERVFTIRKRDLEVECDFSTAQTTVLARVNLTITVGRLLALAALYGIRALKEFTMISNKRKGGANS